MASSDFIVQKSNFRGARLVKGWRPHWSYSREGGGYDNGQNFLSVHWEMRDSNDADYFNNANYVVLHVDSPTDQKLNGFKSAIITAISESGIEADAEKNGFVFKWGTQNTNTQIKRHRSTTVFRVILQNKEHKPMSPEDKIRLVHGAIGCKVDKVLKTFEKQIEIYFQTNKPVGEV